MWKTTITSAVAALALMAASTPADAQEARRSGTAGLFIGAHVGSTGLTILEPRETRVGAGTSLTIGYGFTPRLAVSLTGSAARLDNPEGERYTLGHADLLARYGFASPQRALVPYLSAGLTGRTAQFEVPPALGGGTTEETVATFSAGGGLQYFVASGFALDGSLRYTFGNFRDGGCPDAATEVRTCATSTRLDLGVTWYPGR